MNTENIIDDPKHHWPEVQCYYCGKPAVAVCDGINHFLVNSKLQVMTDHPKAVEYCNRSLCEDHAKSVGMSTARGHVDSIDYCPKHQTMQKLGEDPELKVVSQ